MKVSLYIILFLTTITTTFSQDYQRVEWDIFGVCGLLPTSNNISNAVGFYTEPRINLNNKFSIGLNFSWQYFDELFEEAIRSGGITTSYFAIGDYYIFNDMNKRAFIGLGAGSFNNSATTELGEDVGGVGVGIISRIGYEFNYIRFMLSLNYTLEQDFPNYISIGFGLNIGGRYKTIKG